MISSRVTLSPEDTDAPFDFEWTATHTEGYILCVYDCHGTRVYDSPTARTPEDVIKLMAVGLKKAKAHEIAERKKHGV